MGKVGLGFWLCWCFGWIGGDLEFFWSVGYGIVFGVWFVGSGLVWLCCCLGIFGCVGCVCDCVVIGWWSCIGYLFGGCG